MKNIVIFFILVIFICACSQESDIEINLKQSEFFLQQNLLNPAVIEVERGLQYIVLESSESKLPSPILSDTITADFHGILEDGSVFWSSFENGEPLTIELSKLIPGCQKVISLMKKGDLWRVFIHPSLAYGAEGRPTIPPNAALIFEISLIEINQSI